MCARILVTFTVSMFEGYHTVRGREKSAHVIWAYYQYRRTRSLLTHTSIHASIQATHTHTHIRIRILHDAHVFKRFFRTLLQKKNIVLLCVRTLLYGRVTFPYGRRMHSWNKCMKFEPPFWTRTTSSRDLVRDVTCHIAYIVTYTHAYSQTDDY